MGHKYDDEDAVLRRYLLGDLPAAEGETVEERLLDDPDFFTHVVAMEDTLTDQYVRGLLSPAEIRMFDDHFLRAPERAEKLRFARTFTRHIDDREREAVAASAQRPTSWLASLVALMGFEKPARALALGAAALIIVAAGTWLYLGEIKARRTAQGAEQARVDQANPVDSTPDSNRNDATAPAPSGQAEGGRNQPGDVVKEPKRSGSGRSPEAVPPGRNVVA